MKQYLEATEYIDWQHPAVLEKARQLSADAQNKTEVARRCFEYVRDQIKHSWDYKLEPVTCRASDVLRHGTGYCYAKSHLLAALLRANQIPAGLCYQRLSLGSCGPPYCLHGLNAVWLPDHGWYRIDPRGNKEGIDARFAPPNEQLAFRISEHLEADFPEIWPEPLPMVVRALTVHKTIAEVYQNLPDIELAVTCTADTITF